MYTAHNQNEMFARLKRVFTGANLAAESAMQRWTNGPVELHLEDIQELPLSDVHVVLNLGNEPMTAVALCFQGDLGGTLVLLFDKENGQRLASMLTGRLLNVSRWKELEKSALAETGNLLACAYAMALAEAVGRPLLPSVPSLVQDAGAHVLEKALKVQAPDAELVVVCRTGCRYNGCQIHWWLLFFPAGPLCTLLKEAAAYIST